MYVWFFHISSAKSAEKDLSESKQDIFNELWVQIEGCNEKLWKTTRGIRVSFRSPAALRFLVDGKKSMKQFQERIDLLLLTITIHNKH